MATKYGDPGAAPARAAALGAALAAVLLLAACEGPADPDAAALARDWPSRTALHPDLRTPIAYWRRGPGAARPVVFIHGTPGSRAAWADYLADPPAGTQAIAYDRPGFGASGPDAAVPTLAAQARALDPFLPPPGRPGAILVGHSLGGPIAAAAALAYPGRVAAIVIVAGSLDPALERVAWYQHLADWPGARWLLPDWLDRTNRELLGLKDELEALAARLAELTQPIVILHGTKDGLVPFANVAFMRQAFAGASRLEVIVLDGADHFLPWNAEPAVRAAIGRALRLASR